MEPTPTQIRRRVEFHGARVDLDFPGECERQLCCRLPSSVSLSETPDDDTADVTLQVLSNHELYRDGEIQRRATSREAALDAIVGELHFQLACCARTALFVHAGVVGWRDQAVLFPGRSFAGKSNLVAALVRAGATYYSDEFAILDTQGNVHPYCKTLSPRDQGGVVRPVKVEPHSEADDHPLPVGLVVHTQYRAGATWKPRELTAGETLLALVDNTVRARELPELMLDLFTRISQTSRAVASDRGEATEVVEDLINPKGRLARLLNQR